MPSAFLCFTLIVAGGAGAATGALAAWPATGVPLTTAPGDQYELVAVSDSVGGAFVAWTDFGSPANGRDLVVQRVLDDGSIAAGWPVNGSPLCTAAGDQTKLVLAGDGSGGVYAAWLDARDPMPRVYLQHLDPDGSIASGWPLNGRVVGSVAVAQDEPAIAAAGASGVYIAWTDERAVGGSPDAFVLRFHADGSLTSGWPAAGVPVSGSSARRQSPRLVADAAGGVFAAWLSTASYPSCAQITRITMSGTIANGWPAGGLTLSDAMSLTGPPLLAIPTALAG